MNCPNCGSSLEGKELYCEHCGFVLKQITNEPIKEKSDKEQGIVISKPLAQKLVSDSKILEDFLSKKEKEFDDVDSKKAGKKEKKRATKNKAKAVVQQGQQNKNDSELKIKALEYISKEIRLKTEFQKKFDSLFP